MASLNSQIRFWLAWMGFWLARYFREADSRRFCIFKCWFHWSAFWLLRLCFYGVFIFLIWQTRMRTT